MTRRIDRAHDRVPAPVTETLQRFVDEGLAIQFEDTRSAGALGFLTRLTALTNLPYRRVPDSRFTRHNGPYVLHIQALPEGFQPTFVIDSLIELPSVLPSVQTAV